MVCSADKVKTLTELKKEGKIASTTHIIFFGPALENEVAEAAKEAGLHLVNFEAAISEGLSYKDVELDKVTPDTFYTFSYTSGTTGMPKGVMLTHRNFVSNCGGLSKFDGVFRIREDDVYFSYLPLAHVFERCILLLAAS